MRTKTDLAWASGFWDGEGHVSARGNSMGGRQIKAQITQKDPRVLVRFTNATGLGKMYPKRLQGFWSWNLARIDEVILLSQLLWPWLDELKQDQFETAFATYHALLPQSSRRGNHTADCRCRASA